jgi:hypothetical protein
MGGGKGGSSSAPPAPDPAYVSQQQTASNVNTAVANATLGNTNQVTPYGNLTYNQIGTQDVAGNQVPRYEATTTLSPQMQAILNSQLQATQGTSDLANQYIGRIGDATNQPFSYEGMPAAPQYDAAYRDQAYNSILARNQTAMERDRASLEQQLANKGVGAGSAAWNTGFDDYNRGVNDFRLGADIQSGNEAQRQFQLQGDARSRAIQESLALRNQPINEVSALLGTGGGVQMPTFQNTQSPNVAPTDVSSNYNNAYLGNLAAWRQGQAGQSAGLGGLFQLGGTLGAGAMKMFG